MYVFKTVTDTVYTVGDFLDIPCFLHEKRVTVQRG